MMLNIHILLDELSHFEPVLYCHENTQSSDIRGFRVLGTDCPSWDPELIYITDANYLSFMPQINASCTLIVIGGSDNIDKSSFNHSLLVIPNNISLIDLSNKLSEIFEYYNKWEEDLHTALLQDESLQKLLDTGCRTLKNPICLTDSTKAVLVMAGDFPNNIEGSIFEVQLKERRTPPEVLPAEARKYIDSRVLNDSEPIFLEVQEKNRLATWVICGIFSQNQFFGTMATSDVSARITLGQSSLISYLKRIVEKAIARQHVSTTGEEGLHFVSEQILHGLAISRTVVDYHLSKHGWDSKSSYRLICLASFDENAQFHEIPEKYTNLLKVLYPHAFFCQYENRVLAIDRKRKAAEHNNDFSRLNVFLEEQDLRVGVSMVFNSFMFLKSAYIQCNLALESSSTKRICCFESTYRTCFMSSFKQVASLNSFCHPQILHMSLHGDERDHDYIKCLGSYLINGCNLTATAKKLHLHRNTLDYRLDQISKELNIDLKNTDDDILLLLLISCEIAKSAIGKNKDLGISLPAQEKFTDSSKLEHPDHSELEVYSTIMKVYTS